ncbi:hypothetical protein [Halodesulfovibrio aestuarii]|uniref:Uncharacterized protein n=1 Tax=Halodesulfovibrio aestuarii TaxID=126333 RepID=A0ABV4JUF2_9BACT
MPKSTTPTALMSHLNNILYPIQAYAEVLQRSDVDHASLAGYVLDALCNDAEGKMEKLTDALEKQFGSLGVKGSYATEIVREGKRSGVA